MAHAMNEIIRRSVVMSIRLCEYFLNNCKCLILIKKTPFFEGDKNKASEELSADSA